MSIKDVLFIGLNIFLGVDADFGEEIWGDYAVWISYFRPSC